MEAWKATDPDNNPDAPSTPFEMADYVNANREKSRDLEAEAQEKLDEARDAISISDFYVMLTVLFASVLFFAGICTKFKTPWVGITVLCTGGLLFMATLIITITQPIK